jgi:protein-S-isoprenylcysteine O-methyltransferase Ste14
VYLSGWLIVLATTFLLNHFELFGLRHVWLYWRGRPYTALPFRKPGPYRVVRHPLYVGWLIVFWATPTMTAAHLVFAAGMTLYILVAIRFEERDLVAHHGEAYAEYRRQVPMLIPLPRSEACEENRKEPVHNATSAIRLDRSGPQAQEN